MKKNTAFLALIFTLSLGMASLATAQHHASADHQATEEDAIREAVGNYLKAHATGDGSYHQKVFHKEAKLFWIQADTLRQRTSDEYIAGAPGKPADNEDQRKRRIVMIDVTGTAAVVKVELDYPGALFTDYFAMLKIEGEWKIVNKIFHIQRDR